MTARSAARKWSVTSGALLLGSVILGGTGGMANAASQQPAATPAVARSAPITHADADSLGSTIRLHEPVDTSVTPTVPHMRMLAVAAQPYGMDVSNYQGNIDWAATKQAGAAFVYIKATEATGYQNSYFTSQYNGSAAAGLIRGAYHFALPDRSSGATQADYFVAHGGGWSADGHTLPPMLDIEYNPYGASTCYGLTPSQMVDWIRDFSSTVYDRTGRYPLIYTSTYWWNLCTGSNATFGATNPLFVARYASTPGPMPAGWAYQSIWQYNDHGSFPGDADVFNGSHSQLTAFAGTPQSVPVSAPASTPVATRPPVVIDPIDAYYTLLGGQSRLGAPTGAVYRVDDGEARSYQKGSIYYSAATGAHLVYGAILDRYRMLGGPTGPLGFPTTDERGTPDGVGRYNHFAGSGGSSIYWTPPTGAHEVQGAIRAHWAALGWERGLLGYPTTDETATRGPGGRYNNFVHGAITWTPAVGAHETHGDIRLRWAALGYETSQLGFPTSDEYSVPGGRRSNFAHGTITWRAANRATTTAFS